MDKKSNLEELILFNKIFREGRVDCTKKGRFNQDIKTTECVYIYAMFSIPDYITVREALDGTFPFRLSACNTDLIGRFEEGLYKINIAIKVKWATRNLIVANMGGANKELPSIDLKPGNYKIKHATGFFYEVTIVGEPFYKIETES